MCLLFFTAAAIESTAFHLQTIMANGGFGMTVLTALTAQNSTGVQGIHIVPAAFLQQQLGSIFTDLPPAAVKTGMLPDAAAVETVANTLRQYGAGSAGQSNGAAVNAACRNSVGAAPGNSRPQALPVVVDPVMVSTSGHSLVKESVCSALKQHLIPLATMITPNLAEAQALLGEED
jgi:hydroxymethylpyrimidine/phosphomethylpyrimidine kinase